MPNCKALTFKNGSKVFFSAGRAMGKTMSGIGLEFPFSWSVPKIRQPGSFKNSDVCRIQAYQDMGVSLDTARKAIGVVKRFEGGKDGDKNISRMVGRRYFFTTW